MENNETGGGVWRPLAPLEEHCQGPRMCFARLMHVRRMWKQAAVRIAESNARLVFRAPTHANPANAYRGKRPGPRCALCCSECDSGWDRDRKAAWHRWHRKGGYAETERPNERRQRAKNKRNLLLALRGDECKGKGRVCGETCAVLTSGARKVASGTVASPRRVASRARARAQVAAAADARPVASRCRPLCLIWVCGFFLPCRIRSPRRCSRAGFGPPAAPRRLARGLCDRCTAGRARDDRAFLSVSPPAWFGARTLTWGRRSSAQASRLRPLGPRCDPTNSIRGAPPPPIAPAGLREASG